MPTKIIREPCNVDALAALLRQRKLPLTVSWTQGAPRTAQQNRLAQRWYTDIARQLGDQTHEDVRAECKLSFGVPILRAENDAFAMVWDRRFGSLPREVVLEEVKVLDIPVTRLMNVKQMTAFMDEMQRFWTARFILLTDPEAMKYEMEFAA